MDGAKKAFVCKTCGSWGYASKSWFCTYDGTEMTPIPYRSAEWERISAEEKNRVIRHWMNTSIWNDLSISPKEARKGSEQEKTDDPLSEAHPSLWISLLRGTAYLIMLLGILSSLIYGLMLLFAGRGETAGILGIFVIIGGCLLSILSVAGIMVFLDIAADIRTMRILTENNRKK